MNNTNRRNLSRVPRNDAHARDGNYASAPYRDNGGDTNKDSGRRSAGRSSFQDRDREGVRNKQPDSGLSTRDAQGRTWKKMDLHLHTPASSDYRDPGISYLAILKKAEEKQLDMIAFADHNTVGGYAAMHREIETLTLLEKLSRLNEEERTTLNEYRRLLGKIVVLPAFEFTATFGFHILGIFPEGTSVRKLEYLLMDLNVPEEKMVAGAPDVGYSSDVLRAYQVISSAGGLAIAAHANSSNGVAMQGFPLGGQTKIAYTQDPNLSALEVTDLEAAGRRTTPSFFNGSKPEYPRRMHCLQGSDAHSLETEQSDSANKRLGVGARVTEINVKEASFNSLKEILIGSDFTRIRPYRGASPWDFAERARSEGPNIIQSFHERAMTKTSRTRPILNDIIAFANTQGGIVYVGVNPNANVAVHGVDRPEDDVRLLKVDLQRSIEPQLDVQFDIKQSGNRAVVLVTVPEGEEPPYVYTPTGQIFVREEDETAIASRDEIINLVRKSGEAQTAVAPIKDRLQERLTEAPIVELPTAQPLTSQSARGRVKATPVPTVPQPLGAPKERLQQDVRAGAEASTRQAEAGASTDTAPLTAPGTDTRRLWPGESQPSSSTDRPSRSPGLANLPPERLKGKVQPMLPRGLPAPASGELSTQEEPSAGEQESSELVSSQLGAVQLGESIERVVVQPTTQLEESPAPAKGRRGRGQSKRTEEAVTAMPPAQSVDVADTPPEAPAGERSRSRSRRAEAQAMAEMPELALPMMEATVSSEHETREEIVAEAAAKPKRGRRRSTATQREQQQLEIDAPTAAAAATEAGEQAILTQAEMDPGPQVPGELGAGNDPAQSSARGKGRSRRKKGVEAQIGDQAIQVAPHQIEVAVDMPTEQESAPAPGKKGRRGQKKATQAANETPTAVVMASADPPSTGVEIISTENRNGVNYHTMRDLRNHSTVHNVTRHSARRLWHYAILQHEHGEPAMSEVAWHPDQPVGIWRRGHRAGDMRYDLVSRYPDGTFEVYYGVTEEGLHGLWSELVQMAEDAEYWGPEANE